MPADLFEHVLKAHFIDKQGLLKNWLILSGSLSYYQEIYIRGYEIIQTFKLDVQARTIVWS